MLCLLCTTEMREVLHSRGAETFGDGFPFVFYRCPRCETSCQDHLAHHGGQHWLFANGATCTFPKAALEDPDFCARFRLEP